MRWEISTIYLVIIGIEVFISNYQQRKLYTWNESFSTILLSLMNGLLDLGIRGMYLIVFTFIYQFRVLHVINPLLYWPCLFLLLDFQFYWLHRLEHFCRIFWAAHVTHHSAEHMNISVGFRASLMRPLYDFIFFIPIALLGFRPIDILLMYSITQLYAVLQHTELIRNLGWIEYVFVTPSHHRVHHASNQIYIDKNMGMVLIIWDRLFSTFQKELPPSEYEPIRYGLVTPLKNQQIHTVIFQEWKNIWRDITRKDISFREKYRYLFGRPGWKHEMNVSVRSGAQEHNKQSDRIQNS